MTAKEYLTQALSIERLLAAKRRLLKKLQWQSISLSAPMSSDKVMGAYQMSMSTADKIMDLETEIRNQEQELVERQKEIIKRIGVVGNPNLIALLIHKYVTGMSIEKVAEEMNISRRTACVWHGQALQIFRKETGLT